MKKLFSFLLMFSVLLIGGCSIFSPTATAPQIQTTYSKACLAYAGALQTASTLTAAGKLSTSSIAEITQIDQQITPICSQPAPADATAVTQQITTAVTNLLADSIIQQSQGK